MEWLRDSEQFISDEETLDSARGISADIILHLTGHFRVHALEAFVKAAQTRLNEAASGFSGTTNEKISPDEQWKWKESVLDLFTLVADELMEHGSLFDAHGFAQTILQPSINDTQASPFLRGTALRCAGSFIEGINT